MYCTQIDMLLTLNMLFFSAFFRSPCVCTLDLCKNREGKFLNCHACIFFSSFNALFCIYTVTMAKKRQKQMQNCFSSWNKINKQKRKKQLNVNAKSRRAKHLNILLLLTLIFFKWIFFSIKYMTYCTVTNSR